MKHCICFEIRNEWNNQSIVTRTNALLVGKLISTGYVSVTITIALSLQCRRILGARNLVRVRNIVVAAIFD